MFEKKARNHIYGARVSLYVLSGFQKVKKFAARGIISGWKRYHFLVKKVSFLGEKTYQPLVNKYHIWVKKYHLWVKKGKERKGKAPHKLSRWGPPTIPYHWESILILSGERLTKLFLYSKLSCTSWTWLGHRGIELPPPPPLPPPPRTHPPGTDPWQSRAQEVQ